MPVDGSVEFLFRFPEVREDIGMKWYWLIPEAFCYGFCWVFWPIYRFFGGKKPSPIFYWRKIA